MRQLDYGAGSFTQSEFMDTESYIAQLVDIRRANKFSVCLCRVIEYIIETSSIENIEYKPYESSEAKAVMDRVKGYNLYDLEYLKLVGAIEAAWECSKDVEDFLFVLTQELERTGQNLALDILRKIPIQLQEISDLVITNLDNILTINEQIGALQNSPSQAHLIEVVSDVDDSNPDIVSWN